MTFFASIPFWYWLIALLAGAVYAFLLYFKQKQLQNKALILAIAAFMRGSSVVLLVLLLLNPFIKREEKVTEEPLLLLARDRSSSMPMDSKLEKLSTAFGKEVKPETLSFGEKTRKGWDNAENKDAATNISELFKSIGLQYGSRPLAGLIVETDGIFNQGESPLQLAMQLQMPIYFIARGDTQPIRDIGIDEIKVNSIVFKGVSFPLDVQLKASLLSGNVAEVTLYDYSEGNKKAIGRQSVSLTNEQDLKNLSFLVDANQSGLKHYRVEVKVNRTDLVPENNYRDFYVEVLENRTRILLLAAAPHPDIAVIRQALESLPQYELSLKWAKQPVQLNEEPDLIILHQFPTTSSAASPWFKLVLSKEWPCWFITGSQTSLIHFNQLQQSLKITTRSNATNKAMASWQSNFNLFVVDPTFSTKLANYPPLDVPFGEYQQAVNLISILSQRIGNVESTFPLWAFTTNIPPRRAFTTGEGLWRWKLHEAETESEMDLTFELIRKTIGYLSIKEEKTRFKASSNKKLFSTREAILFSAELYNKSYESINEPEVRLVLTNSKKEQFKYTFAKTVKRYSLNIGSLPEGDYRYQAEVEFEREKFVANGGFSVAAVNLEKLQTRANHDILRQIANASGGRLISEKEGSLLMNELKEQNRLQPISYYEQKVSDLIQQKWLLALILLFLTIEWLIRRISGNY